jgi:hypothetical protein
MRQEGERQAEIMQFQADCELREAAWKDVQNYLSKQREDSRRSLAWRLADAHRKHEIALVEHQVKIQALHFDFQCRREDWLAVQDYKLNEEERRRKSLSLRLESWRQMKVKEAQTKEQAEMMKEEDALLREMDREELIAAKLAQDMIDRRNLLSTDMVL